MYDYNVVYELRAAPATALIVATWPAPVRCPTKCAATCRPTCWLTTCVCTRLRGEYVYITYILGTKFEHDLHHVLTRATAFEAVMRVRATRGVRFSNFYGNYFIRGTDLLALPNCTSDSSFSLDMAYDEAVLSAQAITIQVLCVLLIYDYIYTAVI